MAFAYQMSDELLYAIPPDSSRWVQELPCVSVGGDAIVDPPYVPAAAATTSMSPEVTDDEYASVLLPAVEFVAHALCTSTTVDEAEREAPEIRIRKMNERGNRIRPELSLRPLSVVSLLCISSCSYGIVPGLLRRVRSAQRPSPDKARRGSFRNSVHN